MIEALTGRYPDIKLRRQIIKPMRAVNLGHHLLEKHDITEPTFDRTIGSVNFSDEDHGAKFEEIIGTMCGDGSESTVMMQGIVAARRKMSGLRTGGLDIYYRPTLMFIKLNYYDPREPLESHTDGNTPNDAVAIGLLGKAKFMHTVSGTSGVVNPDESMIKDSWDVGPGDAMYIRNHSTRRESMHWHPNHAVQNGPESRLTLLLEQYYEPRHRHF